MIIRILSPAETILNEIGKKIYQKYETYEKS